MRNGILQIIKKNMVLGMVIISAMLLFGCQNVSNPEGGSLSVNSTGDDNSNENQGGKPGSAGDVNDLEGAEDMDDSNGTLAAWVVYWDNDMAEEYFSQNSEADTICHFAAYFNENQELFMPEGTLDFLERSSADEELAMKKQYICIVNDQVFSDGSSLKDTQLLYNLFSDEKEMDKHISDIISLAIEYDFDGIEIDYECIRKDMDLWKLFVTFEKKLIEKADEHNLAIRVDLEPSVALDQIDFPDGAEYVMMCYNLYGYNEVRGPKADIAFLKKMAAKMENMPGKINFAFANGGYDFPEGKKGIAVSNADIDRLLDEHNPEITRAADSGAVYFDYTDGDGVNHQVWYADEDTLNTWMETLKAMGYNRFSIWRVM